MPPPLPQCSLHRQKDRWWLDNVYRGDMAQLTLRSGLTGFLLGGVLAATALYIGGKTGISIGVGLTSVILAFAIFRTLAGVGLVRDITILENNCTQSIATAAGYMITPLISSLAAYMLVTGRIVPVVADDGVDRRDLDTRRAGGVSDEAALHQRGPAAVSRRAVPAASCSTRSTRARPTRACSRHAARAERRAYLRSTSSSPATAG
jgi:hypothetical protein